MHWRVQLPAGPVRYNNSFFATGTLGVAGSDYDGSMPPAGTGTHRYVYSIEAQNGADAVLGTAEVLGKI